MIVHWLQLKCFHVSALLFQFSFLIILDIRNIKFSKHLKEHLAKYYTVPSRGSNYFLATGLFYITLENPGEMQFNGSIRFVKFWHKVSQKCQNYRIKSNFRRTQRIIHSWAENFKMVEIVIAAWSPLFLNLQI